MNKKKSPSEVYEKKRPQKGQSFRHKESVKKMV